jgi:hypothetical protein
MILPDNLGFQEGSTMTMMIKGFKGLCWVPPLYHGDRTSMFIPMEEAKVCSTVDHRVFYHFR